MQAYVEGDVEAFERLFASLAPSLHGFFMRSVGDASAAEDLMQTTFLKLHGARRRWRRGERLRPWVFAIAAHVRVDWLRRQGRLATGTLDDEGLSAADPSSDPGAGLRDRERSERVHLALESLTEPQRVVVHLHRFEGLGFAEIGTILGISEGAAKLRAFRAYAELRKRLGDLVEEGSP
ncbi:MAG TPA: RNA polymerase sigma factor [Anaeromyxobacteraceae bacterium]|nr:RNA polymerase sigma factor [Anaeromyxobacteraceae bacterium]